MCLYATSGGSKSYDGRGDEYVCDVFVEIDEDGLNAGEVGEYDGTVGRYDSGDIGQYDDVAEAGSGGAG